MSDERPMTMGQLELDNNRLRDVLLRFPEGMTLDTVLSEIVTHYPDDPYAIFLTSELSGALRELPDPRDATIARLTEELTQARTDTLREQRAVTLALDMRSAAYAERDAALSELAGVRAKVEEAVAEVRRYSVMDSRDAGPVVVAAIKDDLLAILAPQDETP